MNEQRDIANEIIEYLDDKVAELPPVDALMILSYVRDQLTAYIQKTVRRL